MVCNKRKHTFHRRVSTLVYYVRKHTFVILLEVKFSIVCILEKEKDRQRVSQCEGRDRTFTTHGAFSHYLSQYNTTHICNTIDESVCEFLSVWVYICVCTVNFEVRDHLMYYIRFTIFCSFPLHGRKVLKDFFVYW